MHHYLAIEIRIILFNLLSQTHKKILSNQMQLEEPVVHFRPFSLIPRDGHSEILTDSSPRLAGRQWRTSIGCDALICHCSAHTDI